MADKNKLKILTIINIIYVILMICLYYVLRISTMKTWVVVTVIGIAIICGLYYIITSIIVKSKKPSNMIIQDSAEHYLSEDVNENGFLYLTPDELIFVPRVGHRTVIRIKKIIRAEQTEGYYTKFDVIFEASSRRFDTYAVTDRDEWIDRINNLIETD